MKGEGEREPEERRGGRKGGAGQGMVWNRVAESSSHFGAGGMSIACSEEQRGKWACLLGL